MAETGIQTFKDTWRVAATFIGTVVGAGFASGQEILRFFSHFGYRGIWGIVLTCLFFCITGTVCMLLGQRLGAVSFGEVVRYVGGRRFGPVMDLLVSLFLFGTLGVMMAGAGAVFFQQWGLSYLLGTFVTLVVSLLTVLSGLKGIIKANSVVVPLMIFVCVLAVLPAISTDRLPAVLSGFQPVAEGAAPHWILSALLYVSYNITLGVSVLAPLGGEIKNRRTLFWGGILGGLGLGFLAMIINLAILSHYPDSAQYEIPSLFVAGRLAWAVQLTFSFVLWAEIFTTIIGSIYGLAVRVSDYTGLNYRIVAVVLMVAAFAFSQFGFSGLVGTLYPAFGYISLAFLFSLLVSPLLKRI